MKFDGKIIEKIKHGDNWSTVKIGCLPVHVWFKPGINRIYHHIAGGMRESHLSVKDLQSMVKLGNAKSLMFKILDMRMGFSSPGSGNVVLDYFFPLPSYNWLLLLNHECTVHYVKINF